MPLIVSIGGEGRKLLISYPHSSWIFEKYFSITFPCQKEMSYKPRVLVGIYQYFQLKFNIILIHLSSKIFIYFLIHIGASLSFYFFIINRISKINQEIYMKLYHESFWKKFIRGEVIKVCLKNVKRSG